MQRYNLFYLVHKGLRALLYETSLLLQQTDFDDPAATDRVIEAVDVVLALYGSHAHTEDHLVFAAVASLEPAVSKTFEQEHEEDEKLGQVLAQLIDELSGALPERRPTIGARLVDSFVDFTTFNLRHMAKEEDLGNKALWKHFSDAQLQGITQQIVSKIPPDLMALFSKWMLRGLSNREIASWLLQVKHTAPAAAFQDLTKRAEQELTGCRWQSIRQLMEAETAQRAA